MKKYNRTKIIFASISLLVSLCFLIGLFHIIYTPTTKTKVKHTDTIKLNSRAYLNLMSNATHSLSSMPITTSKSKLKKEFQNTIKDNNYIKAICLANEDGIVTSCSDQSYANKDYSLDSFFQTIISGNATESYSILVPDVYGQSSYITAIAISDSTTSTINGVLFAYVTAD